MSDTTSTFASDFAESATKASEYAYETATAHAGGNSTTDFIPPINISLSTPIIYLTILVATIITFSIYHRRTKIRSLQALSSSSLFFPSHNASDTSLSSPSSSSPTEDSTPSQIYNQLKVSKAHDKVLKAALVRRGAESLRRIIKLKESEAFVNNLYVKGSIGDDSFKRFKLQVKVQDAEMGEIAREAESFKPGWSQIVFAACQEVMLNEALRRRLNSISERKEILQKEWVDGVEELLKSLEDKYDIKKQELTNEVQAAIRVAQSQAKAKVKA